MRGEVNHAALIEDLAAYDGWALSTSAGALPAVLALCPPGVRVAAWHRGERSTASRLGPCTPGNRSSTTAARQLSRDAGDARRTDSIVSGAAPAHHPRPAG